MESATTAAASPTFSASSSTMMRGTVPCEEQNAQRRHPAQHRRPAQLKFLASTAMAPTARATQPGLATITAITGAGCIISIAKSSTTMAATALNRVAAARPPCRQQRRCSASIARAQIAPTTSPLLGMLSATTAAGTLTFFARSLTLTVEIARTAATAGLIASPLWIPQLFQPPAPQPRPRPPQQRPHQQLRRPALTAKARIALVSRAMLGMATVTTAAGTLIFSVKHSTWMVETVSIAGFNARR